MGGGLFFDTGATSRAPHSGLDPNPEHLGTNRRCSWQLGQLQTPHPTGTGPAGSSWGPRWFRRLRPLLQLSLQPAWSQVAPVGVHSVCRGRGEGKPIRLRGSARGLSPQLQVKLK